MRVRDLAQTGLVRYMKFTFMLLITVVQSEQSFY
jgi:hypothetical protein